MFAALVVGVSFSFSLIQWGVHKLCDELYWNLYKKHVDKKREDEFNRELFDSPFDGEISCNGYEEIGDDGEVEYYVAERGDK
jgi:hypothetical protein